MPNLKALPKTLYELIKQTYEEWKADKATRLAAALAYYTAFSLAPLLVVIIAVLGFIVSEDSVQNRIMGEIEMALGPDAAEFVNDLIVNRVDPQEGILSTVLGIGTLLVGAVGALGQLQGALNTIWGVDEEKAKRKHRLLGIGNYLKEKLFSFGILLTLGFFALVSLVVSTSITAFDNYILELVPAAEFALQAGNLIISFGLTTLLFALMYKFVPETEIKWRDVWVGAALTALLFTIGKYLLGLYLGRTSTASVYGAAGSFVLMLLWIYYSAQIVLFGAEFTQVYAKRVGSHMPLEGELIAAPEDDLLPESAYDYPQNGESRAVMVVPVPIESPSHVRRNVVLGAAISITAFVVAIVGGIFKSHQSPEDNSA